MQTISLLLGHPCMNFWRAGASNATLHADNFTAPWPSMHEFLEGWCKQCHFHSSTFTGALGINHPLCPQTPERTIRRPNLTSLQQMEGCAHLGHGQRKLSQPLLKGCRSAGCLLLQPLHRQSGSRHILSHIAHAISTSPGALMKSHLAQPAVHVWLSYAMGERQI